MNAIVVDAEKLRELDEDTRRAWNEYRERLRELTGAEYDAAEGESWSELQSELARLDQARRSLSGNLH